MPIAQAVAWPSSVKASSDSLYGLPSSSQLIHDDEHIIMDAGTTTE
ncbi:hypothetical protein R6G79_03035 [Actinotignum urinale]|nr:hypothetical protein [Actinotignum urinale]MDY5160073.1 hypothetical protein [Actinotignum urinale]